MNCLLLNQPMSLRVTDSLCFTDNAPGAPLSAYLYLCKHSDGRWTAHLESHDPDNFPGTAPRLDVIADRPSGDEDGQDTLKCAMASEMVLKKGLVRRQGVAPAAERLLRVCNGTLELGAVNAPFHGELYLALSKALSEDASLGVRPTTEFFQVCRQIIQGAQQGGGPLEVFTAFICDMAAPMQEGLQDLIPILERMPAAEAQKLLSAGMVSRLEQTIEQTLATSAKPPMTYRIEHFIQALKVALRPAS
jgi:hypothetical protein